MNREEQPSSVRSCGGDKQGGEDLWQRYGAKPGVWTKPMLGALERGPKGNKWFSLMDKVTSERTLGIAWDQVRKNAGACGVDRISVDAFAKDSCRRLLAVNERLKKGNYRSQAVRRVYIDKGKGKKRPLGIPTVIDRVVQTAVKMVIEPIFEKEFSPHSYGFRPGVGCHDALREVQQHLKDGFVHVVDIDIEGYFDNIPHAPLMERVKERVADGRVLELLEGFLKQGVMEEGIEWKPEKGSPQGGVISPLLANVYLNPLDWLVNSEQVRMVRYADDMVILCRSEESAHLARARVEQWMDDAQLTLHPEKTRNEDMSREGAWFDFLGYRFKRGRNGKLLRLVRPKSLAKFKESIRKKTRRCNKRSMEDIAAELRPKLQGWFGYFKQAHRNVHQGLDKWLRRRLRSMLGKRRGKRGMRRTLADHRRWPNDYFETLGFYSLSRAREEYLSLRVGEMR